MKETLKTQAEKLTALKETVKKHNEKLVNQKEIIKSQSEKLTALKETLKTQAEKLTALKETVKKHNEKYIKFKKEFSKIRSKEYLQIYYTVRFNGITPELLDTLEKLDQSKYSWLTCHKKIWLIYIMCLLKLNRKEEALKVLKKYDYFHNKDSIQKYFPVSKFAHENDITNELIEQSAKCYDIIEQNNKDEVLKNLIEGKRIALVGNGPCEIGKNKGKEIDSHDIVIRFNNFKIEGYENDYGSKTDIWSCNLNPDVEYKNNDFKLVILAENVFARGYNGYDIFHKLTKNNVSICCFNEEQTYGLTKNMNYNPTFGYRLIYGLNNILGSLDNVDFYGFNFLKEEKDKYTYHYFNDIDFSSEDEIESVHDLLDETEKLIEFINAHRNENV